MYIYIGTWLEEILKSRIQRTLEVIINGEVSFYRATADTRACMGTLATLDSGFSMLRELELELENFILQGL